MEDALQMHKLYAFTYLAHKNGTGSFSKNKVIIDDSFKQFSTFNSALKKEKVGFFFV